MQLIPNTYVCIIKIYIKHCSKHYYNHPWQLASYLISFKTVSYFLKLSTETCPKKENNFVQYSSPVNGYTQDLLIKVCNLLQTPVGITCYCSRGTNLIKVVQDTLSVELHKPPNLYYMNLKPNFCSTESSSCKDSRQLLQLTSTEIQMQ